MDDPGISVRWLPEPFVRLGRVTVLVDGVRRGALRPGATLTVTLHPGPHTVEARLIGAGSGPVRVAVPDARRVELVCGTRAATRRAGYHGPAQANGKRLMLFERGPSAHVARRVPARPRLPLAVDTLLIGAFTWAAVLKSANALTRGLFGALAVASGALAVGDVRRRRRASADRGTSTRAP